MSDRKNIPSQLKRRVRQQCAFGCVLCGKPIYEYDHIIEYNKVKCHEFENLVLLCREHHALKTQNSLNVDLVKEKRLNPYNKDKSTSSPYGFASGNNPYWVVIGDNRYPVKLPENTDYFKFPALSVGNIDIVSVSIFREGPVSYSLPSVTIDDENRKRLVLIVEGETTRYDNSMSVGLHEWDIECTNQKIVIRKAKGKILLEIEYQAMGLWLKRATIYDRGEKIEVREDGVHFSGGGCVSGSYATACSRGLAI